MIDSIEDARIPTLVVNKPDACIAVWKDGDAIAVEVMGIDPTVWTFVSLTNAELPLFAGLAAD